MISKPVMVRVEVEGNKLVVTQTFEPMMKESLEDECAFFAAQIAAALHHDFPLQYNWFPVGGGYCGKARSG